MIEQTIATGVFSANQAFYEALNRMCQADRVLRGVIREAYVSQPGTLKLIVQTVDEPKVWKKMNRLVRLILTTEAQFEFIEFNQNRVCVSQLLKLFPGLAQNPEGVLDRKRKMEQLAQNAERYRALLGFATHRATVFIVATNGVYKDIHLQRGVAPKIPPEQMLNRSLLEVLPDAQVAAYILENIQQAYAENKARTIEYGLWDRQYRSEIYPSGLNEVAIVCCRVS
jgi:hypothetical protein